MIESLLLVWQDRALSVYISGATPSVFSLAVSIFPPRWQQKKAW